MKRPILLLVVLSLLAGCKQETLSSSVSFDPHKNKHLTATITSVGDLDKIVSIKGVPDYYFELMVGVCHKQSSDMYVKQSSHSESRTQQVPLELKNGKLATGGLVFLWRR